MQRDWSSQSLVGVYTFLKSYFKIEITYTMKSTLLRYNSVFFHLIHEVMQPSLVSNSRIFLSTLEETLHSFAATPYLELSPDFGYTNLLSISMDLPILHLLFKWNYKLTWPFCAQLLSLRLCFQGLNML